ncbi:MAG: hypothetical protein M3R02_21145 [Chloroflexota bacterium]|nr:hypothetical protein [Chloroflexota bacterium]
MCHDPRTAQAMWAIRRGELLTEAAEARRVGVARRPRERGPLVAVGMRRLGAALIGLWAHVGAAPFAPAPPTPLADPDPVR